MDLDESLKYSFEEQSFIQLERLREELQKIQISRKWAKHRLYKYNIFEPIDSTVRTYLDKCLCYSLKNLGKHLNDNLQSHLQSSRSSIMSTPTLVRDFSLSQDSVAEPTNPDVVVVSSDEDDEPQNDDDEVVGVQENATPADQPVRVKQEASSEINFVDLTNIEPEQFKRNKTLMVVDKRNLANYYHDKHGCILLKPKSLVTKVSCLPKKQAFMLHLTSYVLRLIQNNIYAGKRELYYKLKTYCQSKRRPKPSQSTQQSATPAMQGPTQPTISLIMTQTQATSNLQSTQPSSIRKDSPQKLDNLLDDFCCLLGCSRVYLHILTQPKSLVYGALTYRLDNGEEFDCLDNKDGTIIPTGQSSILSVKSSAKFILILEKDSIFQKVLRQEEKLNFIKNYRAIIFTAKGYPDIAGRAFINFLYSRLKVPVFVLADADPHGIAIACCYKLGCQNSAPENMFLAVPQIKWIGLLPQDVEKLAVPQSKTAPLSLNDIKKIDALLAKPFFKRCESWTRQLQMMLESGRKAELEAIDGEFLVKTYLPNKLRFASWL